MMEGLVLPSSHSPAAAVPSNICSYKFMSDEEALFQCWFDDTYAVRMEHCHSNAILWILRLCQSAKELVIFALNGARTFLSLMMVHLQEFYMLCYSFENGIVLIKGRLKHYGPKSYRPHNENKHEDVGKVSSEYCSALPTVESKIYAQTEYYSIEIVFMVIQNNTVELGRIIFTCQLYYFWASILRCIHYNFLWLTGHAITKSKWYCRQSNKNLTTNIRIMNDPLNRALILNQKFHKQTLLSPNVNSLQTVHTQWARSNTNSLMRVHIFIGM